MILQEVCQLADCELTPLDAESAILDFLRDAPGKLFGEWMVLNRLCTQSERRWIREERRFLLQQLNRLVRERKVVRYRKGLLRGKIRISEAFV